MFDDNTIDQVVSDAQAAALVARDAVPAVGPALPTIPQDLPVPAGPPCVASCAAAAAAENGDVASVECRPASAADGGCADGLPRLADTPSLVPHLAGGAGLGDRLAGAHGGTRGGRGGSGVHDRPVGSQDDPTDAPPSL